MLLPQLDALSPGGGAYLNEGDPWQPNWQQVFYGDNYARLRQIKKTYDPRTSSTVSRPSEVRPSLSTMTVDFAVHDIRQDTSRVLTPIYRS